VVARPGEGPGGRPSPVDPSGAEAAGRWAVHRLLGPAGALHARPWPSPAIPAVWVLAVDRPALVLGSAQTPLPPAGMDVVRRRSGGGAVLVEPDNPLWVDVLVPAGDRLSIDDVGRAFLWLGEAWAAALAAAGVDGATVHRGPPSRTPLARAVCFAGLGTGEVTVGGRKVVGISQRRTRAGALFQSAALLRWDPERLAALTGTAPADLAAVAAGTGLPATALANRLLDQLKEL